MGRGADNPIGAGEELGRVGPERPLVVGDFDGGNSRIKQSPNPGDTLTAIQDRALPPTSANGRNISLHMAVGRVLVRIISPLHMGLTCGQLDSSAG